MPSPEQSISDDTRLGRLLTLLGLSGIAIAQPVLDLFGNSPTTFRSHRVEGMGIVLFAVGVVVLPPLLLWVSGEAVVRLHRPTGRRIHLATAALLCFFVGVLFSKGITTVSAMHVLAGALAAGAGWLLLGRSGAVRTWVRVLAGINVVLLIQFTFLSPATDWVDPGIQEMLTVAPEDEPDPTPVVMLVLDEWPTQSIIDATGNIDTIRFPNLAEFSRDATWYRRFTTVSPFSPTAVPALLDGKDPYGEPLWTDHPESLFSLFGRTHDLLASESLTAMCGLPGCNDGLTPIVEPSDSTPTQGQTATPRIEPPVRWGDLIDTAWGVWRDRVRPGRTMSTESFDDFEEELTDRAPTTQTSDPPVSEVPVSEELVSEEPVSEETEALARFFSMDTSVQPRRLEEFVDALQPTDEPFFAFLHLLLPHQPWRFYEDGGLYEAAEGRDDFEDRDSAWPVRVSRQRHLLQAQYTDRLLGSILRRLQEIDEYEDTLIVVVADHGVGFNSQESNRRISEANLEEIAYVPLLIKAPGQTTGTIDDSNVLSVDVAPTIAALAGSATRWDVDGAAIGSPEFNQRGAAKYIYSFDATFEYEFLGIVEFDDAATFPDVIAGRFPSISATENAVAGLYRDIPGADLLGQSADTAFGPVAGRGTVDELDRLESASPDRPALAEIAGQVPEAPAGATVVVAVDDVIVGVSPLYARVGRPNSFVVLVPAGTTTVDGVRIRVGLRDVDGTVSELSLDR